MIDPGAGLGIRGWVLLVLLVCITLPLGGGCSSDPECIAVPFLPQCFEDDDEEKTEDTATQTSVRVQDRADAIDTTMAACTSLGCTRKTRSSHAHFIQHAASACHVFF
jgi:hypothetical protein